MAEHLVVHAAYQVGTRRLDENRPPLEIVAGEHHAQTQHENPALLRQAGKQQKPAYLARFFGSFFVAFLWGSGGVLSILRSTSSGRVTGLGSCFMAEV